MGFPFFVGASFLGPSGDENERIHCLGMDIGLRDPLHPTTWALLNRSRERGS